MSNGVVHDLSYLESKPLADKKWPIMSIAPDLSGSCNLACRYCAESASQPRRLPMDYSVLDKAIEFLIAEAGQTNSVPSIRLGSGEPLLAFPAMKHLAEKLEMYKKNGFTIPKVFLTTNGTLINDEIQEWLVKSDWNIKISLDGPKSIHDKWRVTPAGYGTYDSIAKRIIFFSKHIPEKLSVTSVLCNGNNPDVVFNSIKALGVRRIELVPVSTYDENILPDENTIDLYRRFLEKYISTFLKTETVTKPPILTNLEKYVVRLMGYDIGKIACGAGRSFVGISPDGDIYPCFRFIGIEKYKLGHLGYGLKDELLNEFRNTAGRSYEQREQCSQCWAAPLCNGPCFATAEVFGPGNGEPIYLHCRYNKLTAEFSIKLYDSLRTNYPDRLIWFLPKVNEGYFPI